MNEEREEIKKLEGEIRILCEEVYGESGDELIELIERANLFYTSPFILFCDERDTISLCHSFIKQILRDKKIYKPPQKKVPSEGYEYYPYCARCICGGEARLKDDEYRWIQIESDNPPVRYICELCGREFGLVFY